MEERVIAVGEESLAGKEGPWDEELVLVVIQSTLNGSPEEDDPGGEPEDERGVACGAGGVQAREERWMTIDRSARSAGVTPLIRAACPRVSGRTWVSFCRVS